jgi:hypothetical protein
MKCARSKSVLEESHAAHEATAADENKVVATTFFGSRRRIIANFGAHSRTHENDFGVNVDNNFKCHVICCILKYL